MDQPAHSNQLPLSWASWETLCELRRHKAEQNVESHSPESDARPEAEAELPSEKTKAEDYLLLGTDN